MNPTMALKSGAASGLDGGSHALGVLRLDGAPEIGREIETDEPFESGVTENMMEDGLDPVTRFEAIGGDRL